MIRRFPMLALATLTVACARADAPPQPIPLGDRVIVFIGYTSTDAGIVGPPRLYSIRQDGTGLRRLTSVVGPGYTSPAVSRDGRLVAYAADGQLWTMSIDGSGARQVPASLPGCNFGRIAWAPTGDRLAVNCDIDTYIVDVRTGAATNLRTVLNEDVVRADWSWDGTRLAYNTGGTTDIYAASPQGGTPTLLVTDGYVPTWSPDGTRLAFGVSHGLGPTIYVENVDGTGRMALLAEGSGAEWPAWSPDGQLIAFDKDVPFCTATLCTSRASIYITPSDRMGQGLLITPDSLSATRPAW